MAPLVLFVLMALNMEGIVSIIGAVIIYFKSQKENTRHKKKWNNCFTKLATIGIRTHYSRKLALANTYLTNRGIVNTSC